MRKNNPACYECPKSKNALHRWSRKADGTAICLNCYLILLRHDAEDCFEDRS